VEPASTRRHAGAGTRRAGLGELIGLLFAEARALVSDYAELAVLDARGGAIHLAWILACVLIAAVLVATAWMGGVAALVVWMLGTGISWPAAIALAALINLVGAGALVLWMRHLLIELPFAALLRQLRGEDAPSPVPVPSAANASTARAASYAD
jgi:hypothetical protein